MVQPSFSRAEFLARHEIASDSPLVVLLPGSRAGEIERHLPVLLETTNLLKIRLKLSVILATPKGYGGHSALLRFRERITASSIQVVENETWDCIAHSNLALAASGTVTMEAAVLGIPMVTFYKVNPLSWYGGRHLVKVPFLSMVNLIAQRGVVPELIQHEMTPSNLASAAEELLLDHSKADEMRRELARVKKMLTPAHDPLSYVAQDIAASLARPGRIPSLELNLVRETID
jgi:lipid-A-disaccharide synthase